MTKKSSITESKVRAELKAVEEAYGKVQAEIAQINRQGEQLTQKLSAKMQEGMNLKGQYKALKALLGPESRPSKKLSTKKRKKK